MKPPPSSDSQDDKIQMHACSCLGNLSATIKQMLSCSIFFKRFQQEGTPTQVQRRGSRLEESIPSPERS